MCFFSSINSYRISCTMRIEVDYRERELIEALNKFNDVQVDTVNLPIGDAIVYGKSGARLLVERKTLSDLSASIKDKRYSEQSIRLLESSDSPEMVYYLIEGNMELYRTTNKKHLLPPSTLISAMFTLSTEKRFSIHRTENAAESAFWLICISKKMDRTSEGQKSMGSCIRRGMKRSDKINRSNIEEIMLAQIPGISEHSARTLLGHCGGLRGLLKELEKQDNHLAEIKLNGSNGRTRRLGRNVVCRLQELLGTD